MISQCLQLHLDFHQYSKKGIIVQGTIASGCPIKQNGGILRTYGHFRSPTNYKKSVDEGSSKFGDAGKVKPETYSAVSRIEDSETFPTIFPKLVRNNFYHL